MLHPGGEARSYLSLVQVHDINTAQLREPGSCKRSVMPKLRKMSKVNYRQEDEIINSPHRNTGIQYRHEKKEDVTGFIPKPITHPEYGTVYQHQGMLLQNLHCRYLYIVIWLPPVKDLDQKIPSFLNCDNYGICRASNPNPFNDDTRTNDNELHQQLCRTFKIDYLQEMDIIMKVKARLECKINITLLALLPNKMTGNSRGPVTYSVKTEQDKSPSRNTRAFPLLAIPQGTTAIGGMHVSYIL